MRRIISILDINIDRLDTEALLKSIEDLVAQKKQHQISYVNAHCINYAFRDNEYEEILLSSDIVYSDGMGLVWASIFYGNPLPERVNLGDFLPKLCQLCVMNGYKLFLLGGEREVAEKTASNLKVEFPKLNIAGTHDGFFSDTEEECIIKKINESSADILLVGMGVPKQEKWIFKNKQRLKPTVLWSVGGLFDYYAGRIKRAPVWVRRTGIEWLFRLFVEPSRLWKRYIIGNFIFLFRLFLPVIIDVGIVVTAWLAAYWLRFFLNPLFAIPIGGFVNYLPILILVVVTWPFICSFSGIYRLKKSPGGINWLVDILKVVCVGLIFSIVISFIFRQKGIARSFLIIWAAGNFILLVISRRILRNLNLWFSPKAGPLNVLIVGLNDTSLSLKKKLEQFPSAYKIKGFIKTSSSPHEELVPKAEIIGEFYELGAIISSYNIDEVILTDDTTTLSEKLNLVIKYLGEGIIFKIISVQLQPFSEKVKLSQFDKSLPILEVSFRQPTILYLIFKELLDRITAFLVVILAFPVWCLIALIIKLDSNGPAIFVQKRIGKNGREFKLYKFRTMFASTLPDKPAPLSEDDPRITRVGKFLRRWSLDELPQFLNVLKGDMSLVGPRPEMPFIVKDYQPWQRQRLKVKPGITGLWQVAGRKNLPLHENIEYDFYYLNNRSFILDLAIMLKSIPAIILRKGAY